MPDATFKGRVLVAEDRVRLGARFCGLLRRESYYAAQTRNAESTLLMAVHERHDLVVLDLDGPNGDSLDVCRRLKTAPETAPLPVFMLSSNRGRVTVATSFEAGADDFLALPFEDVEFTVRVGALIRRCKNTVPTDGNTLTAGDLRVDTTAHRAYIGPRQLPLTASEFSLLTTFLQNQGIALTRETLLNQTWGNGTVVSPRTIDVHLSHLRAKLGNDGQRLITIRQVGFMFEKH